MYTYTFAVKHERNGREKYIAKYLLSNFISHKMADNIILYIKQTVSLSLFILFFAATAAAATVCAFQLKMQIVSDSKCRLLLDHTETTEKGKYSVGLQMLFLFVLITFISNTCPFGLSHSYFSVVQFHTI
jgi:hypothetical protein